MGEVTLKECGWQRPFVYFFSCVWLFNKLSHQASPRILRPGFGLPFDSHYQSTLDAVDVCVVLWSELPIVPSPSLPRIARAWFREGPRGGGHARRRNTGVPLSQELAPSPVPQKGPRKSYCRVLGGRCFLWARYPCTFSLKVQRLQERLGAAVCKFVLSVCEDPGLKGSFASEPHCIGVPHHKKTHPPRIRPYRCRPMPSVLGGPRAVGALIWARYPCAGVHSACTSLTRSCTLLFFLRFLSTEGRSPLFGEIETSRT